MDFGIHIGTRGCLTSRENIMAVAQRAEALGYTHFGVADHLIVPMPAYWPVRAHAWHLRAIPQIFPRVYIPN